MTLTAEAQRLREEAQTAACTWCQAAIGEVCTGKDGKPLVGAPAHTCRLLDAGAEIRPVRREEVTENWRRKNPDEQLRRGKAEWARRKAELEQRRRELIADARAGQLDEARRAEMVDLDRTLGITPEADPIPEQRDAPADTAPWMRGPGAGNHR